MKMLKVLVCFAVVLSLASAATAQVIFESEGIEELPDVTETVTTTTTYQTQSIPVLTNTYTTYYSAPAVTYSRGFTYRAVSRPIVLPNFRSWMRHCAATRPRLLRR